MSGAFDFGFDLAFDAGGATLVRLELTEIVDDHQRPDHNLWRRYQYPGSQVALGLKREAGTVTVLWDLPLEVFEAYDEIVAGGYVTVLASDSWEATLLEGAGYTLIEVVD